MATFEELYGPTQVALAKQLQADDRQVLALYGRVLLECRAKVRKLYDRYAKDGKLDNADKSMANRLTQLQDEIQKIMDERLPGIIKYQSKLTGEMYEESFYRHCWCIDKGGTVGLDFGLLPKDAVDKAVKGTYDTFGRSRLLLDRTNAVRRLKEDIGLALIRGDSYQSLSAKIASHIGVDIEATKKVRYLHKGLSAWSMLVARTEGQRVIAEGQQAAYQKARDLGCDIEEVWDATLDARTRPEHAMLDQQVKDEEHGGWFVPRLGKYVPAPLHSGDPAFDLNCRCRVTARVKYLNEGDGRRLSYDDWVVDQWSREPELKDKGMERSIQRYQIEKMRLYPENLRIDKENKMGRYGLDPAKTGHAIPVLGAFGIRNDEAGRDYLDSLIRENISKSDIKYTGNIEQGRKYNSILHLKDQNGAEVDLLVSWIYNTYKDPKYGSDTRAAHMTTFYIKK